MMDFDLGLDCCQPICLKVHGMGNGHVRQTVLVW